MNKKNLEKKDNVVNFPTKISPIEKEIEAIIFAAAEPLDVETIESKLSKKVNIEKSLEKLQLEYYNRGINLVCISKKWSFRTSSNLSNLMSQEKTVENFFFFNDTATTEIYTNLNTLSLHEALPICRAARLRLRASRPWLGRDPRAPLAPR